MHRPPRRPAVLTGRQCHWLSDWQLKATARAPAQVEAKQNAAEQAEAAALQERIAVQNTHAAELAERLEAINEISRQRTELQVWHNFVSTRDALHESTQQRIYVFAASMLHVPKDAHGR